MSGNIFRICTVTAEGLIRLDPPIVSPATACKRDPEAFLLFAKDVAKVAEREKAKRAQLRMTLEKLGGNMTLLDEEAVSDIAAG